MTLPVGSSSADPERVQRSAATYRPFIPLIVPGREGFRRTRRLRFENIRRRPLDDHPYEASRPRNRYDPPRMSLTAEDRKTDLVDRLAATARTRVGPDEAGNAEQFVRRYFSLVAPDDIIYSSFDTLIGGALSLWDLGQNRKPGTPAIRLFNPTVETNAWGLEHTVIEIVNDDMPFLVHSVTAEINPRARNIHLLLHPIARVRRDESGNRLELTSTQSSPIDAIVESYMHAEIDQETEPAELEALKSALERVLARVRAAVADWRAMRQRLHSDTAELQEASLPVPAEEVDEARQFLRWLDDGNFIFLGYRRYGFE